jgi:iron transport multicopper oxidase
MSPNLSCDTANSHSFTLKGILAFAFSTFMGIFGIYTVASYGMKKDKKTPETAPLLAEEGPQH